MKFSVAIPFRSEDPQRKQILEWLLHRYTLLLPEAEVVVSSDGREGGADFNRARARNRALTMASHDMVVMADADTLFVPRKIREATRLIAQGGASWVFPFVTYYNANAAWTAQALTRSPAWTPREDEVAYDHRLRTTEAGFLVLTRAAIERVNGWDERFEVWGYEDRAITLALNTLWGDYSRLPGFVVHLDHEGPRFDSPGIEVNQRLHERYVRANANPQKMQALVHEWVSA